VQATLAPGVAITTTELRDKLRAFYAHSPFVRVLESAPRIKDVVASNYANLSATSNGRTIAVMCVVDNLNKGAAGGAVQWMNRLFGLPEHSGLTAVAPGWT
jgi:N-acetyl-gamma-glutamyl-phosphate reductase